MTTELRASTTNPLAEPGIRRALEEFVRRRVPSGEVDDVVQTVLCDALASPARPADPTELRRWLLGIARHKVADHHRRSFRETATELPDLPVGPPPVEARELARWAEEQAAANRDAQQTLSWMAREGEGEKLESIAAEEQVPAARVRQRVSRMRRWMRERWLAELAAVAALAILAFALVRLLRSTKDLPEIAPLPEPLPSAPPLEAPAPLDPLDSLDRARSLRAEALRACDEAAWRRCLDQLDEADRLDPRGRTAPDVAAARQRALDALRAPTDEPPAPGPVKEPAPVKEPTERDSTDVRTSPQPRQKVAPSPAPTPTVSARAAQPLKSKKPRPPDRKGSVAPGEMDFSSKKR